MGLRENKVFVIVTSGFHYLYIGYRPKNREELFNLCHASARNVIERIFGVLKQCFQILLIAPEYSLNIQAQILAALCTIYNFIRTHNTDAANDIVPKRGFNSGNPNDHDYVASSAAAAELDHPSKIRDCIAQEMWEDYIRVCSERGVYYEQLGDEDKDELGNEDKDELGDEDKDELGDEGSEE